MKSPSRARGRRLLGDRERRRRALRAGPAAPLRLSPHARLESLRARGGRHHRAPLAPDEGYRGGAQAKIRTARDGVRARLDARRAAGIVRGSDRRRAARRQPAHPHAPGRGGDGLERDGMRDPNMLVAAITHDLGKVLLLMAEAPEHVVGMTAPIGPHLQGIGLDNVVFQWSHDEFAYSRLRDHVPDHVAWLLRYHSILIDGPSLSWTPVTAGSISSATCGHSDSTTGIEVSLPPALARRARAPSRASRGNLPGPNPHLDNRRGPRRPPPSLPQKMGCAGNAGARTELTSASPRPPLGRMRARVHDSATLVV